MVGKTGPDVENTLPNQVPSICCLCSVNALALFKIQPGAQTSSSFQGFRVSTSYVFFFQQKDASDEFQCANDVAFTHTDREMMRKPFNSTMGDQHR